MMLRDEDEQVIGHRAGRPHAAHGIGGATTARTISGWRRKVPTRPANDDDYMSAKRYPTHGSVRTYLGDAGFGSIFFRSAATSTRRCSG